MEETIRGTSLTQPKPINSGKPVMQWLSEKLAERRRFGAEKYGAELHTFNGRNPVKDAWEESADQLIYLSQLVMEEEACSDLKEIFTLIQSVEELKNYDLREVLLYQGLVIAKRRKINCGIKIDPKDPVWPVVFFDLPTGQVSWHLKAYQGVWDKHTTEEKYERVAAFIRS